MFTCYSKNLNGVNDDTIKCNIKSRPKNNSSPFHFLVHSGNAKRHNDYITFLQDLIPQSLETTT
jgi:hypothetical protein